MTIRAKWWTLLGVLGLAVIVGASVFAASRRKAEADAAKKTERPALEFNQQDVVQLRPHRLSYQLTLPGTVAGAVLVFVPSLAAFLTPSILGGADTYMIGQMVQDRFLSARNWPLGAALGACLAGAAFLALLPLSRRRPARA